VARGEGCRVYEEEAGGLSTMVACMKAVFRTKISGRCSLKSSSPLIISELQRRCGFHSASHGARRKRHAITGCHRTARKLLSLFFFHFPRTILNPRIHSKIPQRRVLLRPDLDAKETFPLPTDVPRAADRHRERCSRPGDDQRHPSLRRIRCMSIWTAYKGRISICRRTGDSTS
jgi:hypothetical protein